MAAFRQTLASLRDVTPKQLPSPLLPADNFTGEMEFGQLNPDGDFSTKRAFAEHLADAGVSLAKVDRISNGWTSLAAFFLRLVASGPKGLDIGADENFILSSEWSRSYRHRVRTPVMIRTVHDASANLLLSLAVHVHGEATEQLLSRQQVFTNKVLFKAIDAMYLNSSGGVKRGARSKDAGSLRRFGKVMRQLELTYDFYSLSEAEIMQVFPKEFDRFKP